MNIKELFTRLEAVLPRSLCSTWDNDGLACCPDSAREVRRVLLALDVTDEVVDRAVKGGFDLILTHHPLMFRGVKALTDTAPTSGKLIRLVRAGIGAISLHTRLDAAQGGVNDTLALLLGLQDVVPFGTAEDGELGRIGRLTAPRTARTFAEFVAKKLGTPAVLLAGGDTEITTVALVGGEGGDFVDAAIAAGAEVFLSGRIGYHRMLDAVESGISLIEAGHFATERPVLARMEEILRDVDPDLEIEVECAPVIETVICKK